MKVWAWPLWSDVTNLHSPAYKVAEDNQLFLTSECYILITLEECHAHGASGLHEVRHTWVNWRNAQPRHARRVRYNKTSEITGTSPWWTAGETYNEVNKKAIRQVIG